MQVQTILHPTDHSDSSRAALRYAVALAHDYGARLIILHVVKTLAPGAAPSPEADAGSVARPAGRVPIEYLLRQGDPVATILSTARERSCDLIVLGRHNGSGWRRLLRPGCADRVLRDAPCPVLIVKAPMMPTALPRDATPECGGQPPSPPPVPRPEATPQAGSGTPERIPWSVSA
jgi:nucleotide-binding universal stress UspA family protein